MAEGLANLPVQVVQSTSDEGKGFINHAISGLKAHHLPDLFHVLYEISKVYHPYDTLTGEKQDSSTVSRNLEESFDQIRVAADSLADRCKKRIEKAWRVTGLDMNGRSYDQPPCFDCISYGLIMFWKSNLFAVRK